MSNPTLAALSEGRLYLKNGSSPPRRHESDFAQEILDRHLRMQQKDAWKTAGGGKEESMMPRAALWGRGGGSDNVPIVVSSVAPGEKEGTISYALETEAVGGLLEYTVSEKHERRLFHREGFRASHLDRHPESRKLVCSIPAAGGSNLAVIDPDGANIHVGTEGDSFDDAPTWIEGEKFAAVFQSAGLARNRDGFVHGLGPFGIERINFKTGEMETLCESNEYDFLQPHMDAKGSLYYIRRPYLPDGPKPPWSKTLKDVLLFPVRLVRAVIHFLDAFSRLFSQKPLMSAGGPKQEGTDANKLWIHGRLLEMKKSEGSESHALAPNDWQLVRCSASGEVSVLARSVLAYDLAPDGTLATTDGQKLFIHRNGKPEKVGELSLTEMVKWI